VNDTSDAAWQKALEFLDETHSRLLEAVSTVSDSELNREVAGKKYTIAYMVHGILRHHVYHAGQIALLKRLATL
jgi:hypothetical protein